MVGKGTENISIIQKSVKIQVHIKGIIFSTMKMALSSAHNMIIYIFHSAELALRSIIHKNMERSISRLYFRQSNGSSYTDI